MLVYGWSWAALVLLLFLFVNMVFDYAKIRLVVEDSRKSLRAALGSFGLVWRNLGLTTFTYALVAVVAVVVLLAYVGVCGWIPRHRGYWLLVQQAYLRVRMGVRLLFFASQTEVYLWLTKPPELPPAPTEPAAAPEPEGGTGAVVEPPVGES